MIVDFHSHTVASDGALEPQALVAMMRDRGVRIFSISDHDTLDAYDAIGVPDFAKVVPAIEINTTWKGNDVHVLGYGVPLGPSKLADVLEGNRVARRERMHKIVANLNGAGYPITYDAVLAEAGPAKALGRPHVAKALIRAGFTSDVTTAFRDLLSRGGPGYMPSHHITPVEAIDAIAQSGAVPVLAHPGRLKDDAIIEELAEHGLVGLEVFYPTHSASQISYYRGKAERLGLVMSGGSDFHDIRYNVRGVGMDIADDDLAPFLDLVLERAA
jgi:predicted metal-dependent phosphoesterase TrpH